MTEIAIEVKNLSKVYRIYDDPRARLKEMLVSPFKRAIQGSDAKYHKEFWALQDISFEVPKGESFGIIGRNGAGKSTLLSIIAGTLTPTTGNVSVSGTVAALLELGSGFNSEFTGIENVFLNGSILGFSNSQIEEKLDEILGFADIGDYVYQPVKVYSSGMLMRLAFAVQACLEPDVLIVDEALGVGDIFFQVKCHARMEKLQQNGTSILFVTHAMGSIEKYCSRALLLHKGKSYYMGPASEAIGYYYNLDNLLSQEEQRKSIQESKEPVLAMPEKMPHPEDWPPEEQFAPVSNLVIRMGDENKIKCTKFGIFNAEARRSESYAWKDNLYLYAEFAVLADINVPVVGIGILDNRNIMIYGKNCVMHNVNSNESMARGDTLLVRVEIPLDLPAGEYLLTIGVSTFPETVYNHIGSIGFQELTQEGESIVGYNAASFSVVFPSKGMTPFFGYCNLPSKMFISQLQNETGKS